MLQVVLVSTSIQYCVHLTHRYHSLQARSTAHPLLLISLIKTIFPYCMMGNFKICFTVESMNIPLEIAQHLLPSQSNPIHILPARPHHFEQKRKAWDQNYWNWSVKFHIGFGFTCSTQLEIPALRDNKKKLASFPLVDFLINDSYFSNNLYPPLSSRRHPSATKSQLLNLTLTDAYF